LRLAAARPRALLIQTHESLLCLLARLRSRSSSRSRSLSSALPSPTSLARWSSAALALTIAAALTGCASVPPATAPASQEIVSGRFAVTAQADGRSDSGSGRFTLTTAGTALTLDLATPIGTTLARLQRDARGVRLTAPRDDGGMATFEGSDPEALLRQAFGWAIPVDGLADWIAGRAAPAAPSRVQTDATGRVSTIEQSGWLIEVQERFAGVSGPPRRLRITRPATSVAPALNLRLVLDEHSGPAQ